MKFSESWLREWVNPQITTQELIAQLTMAGLEVDAVEPVAGAFTGVVVGEILEVEAHPDAEKLRICSVAGHPEGAKQVVCGAPNARVGIKIPFATIGAKLPGDFKIKKAKLRGVESFGMLCAQTELQAGDDDDGLWELPADAPVGADIREYLSLDDSVIEVDLTPNRGDCLSLRGLAREVGVLNRTDVTEPEITAVDPKGKDVFGVSIQEPAACPSYVGRVIKGVNVKAPTPQWIIEKLRRSGVRSIDPIVDVTNYVLLELGQPMHAFDLDKLDGEISVRYAIDGEALTLLDGQNVALKSDTLVIADAGQALAIAGVMGGESSAVSDATQSIFLESAFFAPEILAGKARAYGLHTDSSHRFERGVDSALQALAVERATQLLLDITGGVAGPPITKGVEVSAASVSVAVISTKTITLRKERLAVCLGVALEDALVLDILTRLGLVCENESVQSWCVNVPSYRFDLSIEEDLIEEVARVYGYDNLPTRATQFDINLPALGEHTPSITEVKSHLVTRGFQEVITYSFIDPQLQSAFETGATPVVLQNPISSEMSTMRTTLLPGLVSVLKTNLNRQKSRIKCFESGLRFRSEDGTTAKLDQQDMIAGLVYGATEDAGWSGKPSEADFYDLKGDLESLLAVCATGKEYSFTPVADVAYLHPGRTAAIQVDGQVVGHIGAIHPSTLKAVGISKPVYVFEIYLSAVLKRDLPAFSGISRFPEVSRDLAVVLANETPLAKVEAVVKNAAGEHLVNLKLFDVYRGEGIDPERKSLAFSLTYQHPSRTLKDEEINASMAAVVSRLEEDFDAILR